MPRHHIVPKMLLRRFAEKGKRLAATPREGGPRIIMSIDKACAEGGFYEIELAPPHQDEFPSDMIEKALSNFEGRAAPILDHLVKGHYDLSVEDWYNLTLFVALQLSRGWAFRQEVTQMATLRARPDLDRMITPARARKWLEGRGESPTESEVEAFVERALSADLQLVPSRSSFVQLMLRSVFETLHPLLFSEFSVKVIRLERPTLLLSDQPAVPYARPNRDLDREPPGVATAEAVLMPISRETLMCFQRAGSNDFDPSMSEAAAIANREVASSAHRWIFQHPDDPPVDVGSLPGVPRWKDEIVRIQEQPGQIRVAHRLVRKRE